MSSGEARGQPTLHDPLDERGVCVPAVLGLEKGTCVCRPFPGGSMSTETVAMGLGPGCSHGGQTIDLANRGISEKESDAINNYSRALASVAPLVGASSRRLKGCGFDSHSGHIPRLGPRPHLRHVWEGANQCFSLTQMSLPPCLSAHISLSKINKHVLE